MTDTSYMVHDYPDPPEYNAPACPSCGYEQSDELYYIKGQWVCEDCFDTYVNELGRDGLADELGVDHKRREDVHETL